MDDIYIVKIGNLYFERKEGILFGKYRYTMVDNLDDASFYEDFDYVKKCAEEIGGKVYKIALEKFRE